MKAKPIRSFQEIVSKVGNDLSWYMIYRGISYAQESLHISFDELDESPLQKSLFMYLMKYEMNRLISQHIFFEDCMLSEKAFEEAKDFFILAHRYTTFLLSSYLNYLDEWVSAFDDWVKYPPVPLHNLTMVKKD